MARDWVLHWILKSLPMLKNYLAVAFRSFIRNRIFSVINILGLSIGISASLVIFLIVQYSNSFDHLKKTPTAFSAW
jgi:hypothetical protein